MATKDTDVAPGSLVKAIGWGLINKTTYPEILQTLDVPVIERSKCEVIYKNYFNMTVDETSICAGGEGREPCSADSGLPLTINKTLVGITVWTNPCAHLAYPTVYTRFDKH
ncbi:unnamed protein product [Oppiella nova]|uniref:Peptidase S1 domain-containing protein n=1 Tax=Oppiella nova TaxID=334625 RepID=A0A7R9LZF1_9ACAR|nr:unnamed protein product [Oppiella nova]CAG2168393.1 unnamed protein product [Oppiella nova]